MKTLHIVASPRGERSKSFELGSYATSKLSEDTEVLDLSKMEMPYINEQLIAYNYGFATYESLSDADKKAADIQAKLIEQIQSADHLVISSPMWNFGMPAVLKSYFDLVIKVGVTFKTGDAGFEGLIGNIRKAVVVWASGGSYAAAPYDAYDLVTPHLTKMLAFIGIHNLKTFSLQGVNMDAAGLPANIEKVKMEIDAYVA